MESSLRRFITKVLLKKGDRVRVKKGKYKGRTGTVDSLLSGKVFIIFDEPVEEPKFSSTYLLGRSFFPEEIEVILG